MNIAMGLASGLVFAIFAATAVAETTASQTLVPGTRTATLTNLVLPNIGYSHNLQTANGTMTLTIDDSTGSGDGWNVTVQSSAFVYSGSNAGTSISADGFLLTSAGSLTSTSGQAVDATGGPKVPTVVSPLGALSSARKTVQANSNFGQGTYTQVLDVSLAIPAQSRAGTYTGTLTATISAAP